MEKVNLSKQNLDPNFIGSSMIDPLSICDELITYFESNEDDQKIGKSSEGENLEIKDSIDISILPKDLNFLAMKFLKIFQMLILMLSRL